MSEKEKTSQLSTEDLKRERERVAEQLLASRFGDADHDQLEARFNDIERDLFIRSGERGEYRYKYDVRHHFAFAQKFEGGRVVEQQAGMAQAPDGKYMYSMLRPDKVIDWRNTEAGRRADAALRRTVGESPLDDAGHLIGLQFGTDPRERRNLVAQNYLQNQGGGNWHRSEKDLKKFLNDNTSCQVQVTVTFNSDKFGRQFSGWRMQGRGTNRKNADVLFGENVIHLNTIANYRSRAEGFQHMAQVREARKAIGNTPVKLALVK